MDDDFDVPIALEDISVVIWICGMFINNLHVTRESGCMTNKDKPSCSLDTYLLSLIVFDHPTSWWFTSLVYERCGGWSTPLLSARLGENWPPAFHQISIVLFFHQSLFSSNMLEHCDHEA